MRIITAIEYFDIERNKIKSKIDYVDGVRHGKYEEYSLTNENWYRKGQYNQGVKDGVWYYKDATDYEWYVKYNNGVIE